MSKQPIEPNDGFVGWDKLVESALNLKPEDNGGTTSYYQFDPSWIQLQDVIESRNLDYNQGCILKAAFCFNSARHSGTNPLREINKIIWHANRIKNQLEN